MPHPAPEPVLPGLTFHDPLTLCHPAVWTLGSGCLDIAPDGLAGDGAAAAAVAPSPASSIPVVAAAVASS